MVIEVSLRILRQTSNYGVPIPPPPPGIGNIYTRSPTTPLSKPYVEFLLDIFYQNGIYDVLPLHFVNQNVCTGEQIPAPKGGPPRTA